MTQLTLFEETRDTSKAPKAKKPSITQYTTMLDENRVTKIVKERSVEYGHGAIVDSPESAANVFEVVFKMSQRPQELFCMIALGGAREVKGVFEITRGTVNSSMVHPREVFAPAMLAGAASIIIGHNHPSGHLRLSPQDKEVSSAIKKAGEIVGITLDDHIVCANGDFVSAM